MERVGVQWLLLNKKSPHCAHVVLFGPNIRHKRYIEHYGYFEAGLWPLDKAENELDGHFRRSPGPDAVCPQNFWGGFMPWGGASTWEKENGGPFRETPPRSKEEDETS